MMGRDALSQRAQHLLKLVIEQYIDEGRPIGSKALVEACKLDVSSATIRNVMAELEHMGLLASPHTSSGRVPTLEGYRLFVNHLLTVNPLEQKKISEFEQTLDPDQDLQSLLDSSTNLLSSVSKLACVVTLPKQNTKALTHIEFVQLSDDKILVIIVLNEKEVQNCIVHPEKKFTHSGLVRIGNYLTERFRGFRLNEIRGMLVDDLKKRHEALDDEAKTLIGMMDDVLEPMDKAAQDYKIVGKSNLLPFVEEVGVTELQRIMDAFSEQQEMLSLFDNCLKADGVQIFVGGESEFKALQGCSLVTATYQLESKPVGILGVIGPNRMHYEKVVPLVDITAKLLSSALN